jgi:hypothetical protein
MKKDEIEVVVQRVRTLNFDFTGAIDEEKSDTFNVDTGFDKVTGIELLSTYYADPTEIVEMDFDTKRERFPKGLLANFFQDRIVPVDFNNMEQKNVSVTLKNKVAVARKVQIVLYLERIEEKK